MINSNFRGTGVAIVTPFRSDKSIDFKALQHLIENTIKNKVDYLVVLGTTGETATLSKDEKDAVLNFVIETNKERIPIVAGFGGNNTSEVIESIKSRNFKGIDAILSVSPYYNKPNQNGIYEHYKAIANESPVPIILYNVPGRTSSNIAAETTLRLAQDFKNIIAVKEASGNLEQIMQIIKKRPDGFNVISGDDALTFPLISLGADGVISVIANALPYKMSEMVRSALSGNNIESRKLHYQLVDIIQAIFEDGNPAGVKAALNILMNIPDHVRLPLVKVNNQTYDKLKKMLNNI